MKLTKILLITFCVLLANTLSLYPAFNSITYEGARALGMGGAFVSVEHTGEGILINPATLDFDVLEHGSVTIMYSPLYIGLDDGSFNNGAGQILYMVPQFGFVSVNYHFLSGSTQDVSSLYREQEFVLTFTKRINQQLTLGSKLNYYTWESAKQTDFSGESESLGAHAFSFGIGGFYKFRYDYKVGVFINNINQPRIDDQTEGKNDHEKQLLNLQTGVSFIVQQILFSVDTKFVSENIDILFGGEYYFLNKNNEKFFGIRLGFNFPNLAKGMNLTAGFSVNVIKNFSFDYGFLFPLMNIQSTWGEHVFSLQYRF